MAVVADVVAVSVATNMAAVVRVVEVAAVVVIVADSCCVDWCHNCYCGGRCMQQYRLRL